MMCGRYWIDDGRESVVLRGIIEVVNRRVVVEPVKTSGEIFPADIVPVVASNKSMTPAAFAMRWGYTLPDGRRIINALSETAETKPMFKDGMRQRRCAVPATNFFGSCARRPRLLLLGFPARLAPLAGDDGLGGRLLVDYPDLLVMGFGVGDGLGLSPRGRVCDGHGFSVAFLGMLDGSIVNPDGCKRIAYPVALHVVYPLIIA